MTIASEIQRIKNNIANAYSACEEKGATLPATQNSANLSSTINSIEGGGMAEKYGITVDNFLGDVDSTGKLLLPTSGTLNAVGIKKVDDYALSCKFGGNAWGTSRAQGLAHIIFPDLTYIGNAGFGYFYTYSTDLETVSFPELLQIGQCGMQSAFQNNSKLRSALFPKLKICSGMYSSLSGTFSNCPKLEEVNFDSLETLTQSALSSAFSSCSKLKTLSFPSLNKNSFGNDTNQFQSMLSGVTGCTVHFPIRIKKTIGNWSDVISGFSGTNTVILFDLKATTLNFSCNPNSTIIYIDKDLVQNNTMDVPAEDTKYLAYDQSSNTILVDTLTNLQENETKNVTVDLTQNKQKITLTVNKSNLDVNFTVEGITIPAVEETTGNYVIYYIGNANETLSYFVNGGNDYADAEGIITTNGSNITNTISLSNATVRSFSRPNLTANGTLGGSNFAMACSNYLGSNYGYFVFDGTSNYWWTSTTNSTITFYNPKPIKVDSLVITFSTNSTTYYARNITVEGSNDNENWSGLGTFAYVSGQQRTLNVNSSRFFKYYRLTLAVYSVYIRISDIAINGTYKE